VPRLTKQAIIDVIVAEATAKQFTGDKRDGDAPPITLQNFQPETLRYGAKALRVRLSRLSYAELRDELEVSAGHLAGLQQYVKEVSAYFDQQDRETAAKTLRQRHSELGRRHGLQPAILAAARHYRGVNKKAKDAWHLIEKTPFRTSDGETVIIERGVMHVQMHDGTRKRRGIKEPQWEKRYWPAARPA
jgi:hypothetical protein